jgi:predicted RNase H-like nuclease (RuvC/YqgF family)
MFKATSDNLQRRARDSALNPKAEIDREVWKDKELEDKVSDHKMAMKEVQHKIALCNSKIQKMRADWSKFGRINPHFEAVKKEKERLGKQYCDMQLKMMEFKKTRRRYEATRQVRAVETKGDTFMRMARIMLADDVYEKIAMSANVEWRRLYGDRRDDLNNAVEETFDKEKPPTEAGG